MANHTLILSTTKLRNQGPVTIDFVTSLINRGLMGVEYFGIELDNQEDYIDPDMKLVSKEILYFEFYFDTKDLILYDTLSEAEIDHLILELMKDSEQIELRIDKNHVIIYL